MGLRMNSRLGFGLTVVTCLDVLATAVQRWLCVGPSDRPRRGVLSPTVVHVHTQRIRCTCLKVSCLHNEPVIVC